MPQFGPDAIREEWERINERMNQRVRARGDQALNHILDNFVPEQPPQPPEVAAEEMRWENVPIPGHVHIARMGAGGRMVLKKAPLGDIQPQRYKSFDDMPEGKIDPSRTVKLPPICPKYESQEEANLRLKGCIFEIKNLPYLVENVVLKLRGHLDLYVEGADRVQYMVSVPECPVSFRSLEPGYIMRNGRTEYICRAPAKVYRQGWNQENLRYKPPGPQEWRKLDNIYSILKPLSNRTNLEYSNAVFTMFQKGIVTSVRLSNTVAMYENDGEHHLEYKGRFLGKMKENEVFVDDVCEKMSWVEADLHKVGLRFN